MFCDPDMSDRINSYALVSYIPGRLGDFITSLRQVRGRRCRPYVLVERAFEALSRRLVANSASKAARMPPVANARLGCNGRIRQWLIRLGERPPSV